MEDSFLAAALRPILMLAVFAAIVIPIRLLLEKIIPNGKIKEFLFKRR